MDDSNDSSSEHVQSTDHSSSACKSRAVTHLKSYSEGISLQKEGPKSSTAYKAKCSTVGEKSYHTSVTFVPKLMPKRFITYLTIDEAWMMSPTIYTSTCSIFPEDVKFYTSSASIVPKPIAEQDPFVANLTVDESSTYSEVIEFERKIAAKDFSETVNSFPKERNYSYRSTFSYDPFYTRRNYMAGIEIVPTQKVSMQVMQSKLSSAAGMLQSDAIDNCFGEESLTNGDCDNLRLVNGI